MDDLIKDMIESMYKHARVKVQHCQHLIYLLAEMEVVQYGNTVCSRDAQTFLRNERFLQDACDSVEKQLLYFEERLDHNAKGRCHCYMVRRNLSIFKVNAIHEPKHNLSARILATEKFMQNYNLYHTACRDTIQMDSRHRCSSCCIDDYQSEVDGLFFKKKCSSARHPRGSLELHLKHKTYFYLLESDHFYCVMKTLSELEKEMEPQPSTSKQGGSHSHPFQPYRRNLFSEIKESEPHLAAQLRQTARKSNVVSGADTPDEPILAARAAADRQYKFQRVEQWVQGTSVGQEMKRADSDEGSSTYSEAIGLLMADEDVLLAGINEEELQEAVRYVKRHRDHQDTHPPPQ